MGFKMGTARSMEANNGEVKSKLGFGKKSGDGSIYIPGHEVIRKPLGEGIMAEANMDGTIFLNKNIEPGSDTENQVLMHEMRHATDMKIGKLSYSDTEIKWNGEVFPREDRDGKDMIKVYGKWMEAGSDGFPWEHEANNGNAIK